MLYRAMGFEERAVKTAEIEKVGGKGEGGREMQRERGGRGIDHCAARSRTHIFLPAASTGPGGWIKKEESLQQLAAGGGVVSIPTFVAPPFSLERLGPRCTWGQ